MWYRVFGMSDLMPQPVDLQRRLREAGFDVPLDVKGDDLGWTRIDIPVDPPLRIERFLTDEDDLRDQLDAWAAVIECWSNGAVSAPLMQRIISTRQLFTLNCPGEAASICEGISRFLAEQTAGLYEVDGRGFFTAAGALLLAEA